MRPSAFSGKASGRCPLDSLGEFPVDCHHGLERPPHLLGRFSTGPRLATSGIPRWIWSFYPAATLSGQVLPASPSRRTFDPRTGFSRTCHVGIHCQRCDLSVVFARLRAVALSPAPIRRTSSLDVPPDRWLGRKTQPAPAFQIQPWPTPCIYRGQSADRRSCVDRLRDLEAHLTARHYSYLRRL